MLMCSRKFKIAWHFTNLTYWQMIQAYIKTKEEEGYLLWLFSFLH